jgi:hypothetical protein
VAWWQLKEGVREDFWEEEDGGRWQYTFEAKEDKDKRECDEAWMHLVSLPPLSAIVNRPVI